MPRDFHATSLLCILKSRYFELCIFAGHFIMLYYYIILLYCITLLHCIYCYIVYVILYIVIYYCYIVILLFYKLQCFGC